MQGRHKLDAGRLLHIVDEQQLEHKDCLIQHRFSLSLGSVTLHICSAENVPSIYYDNVFCLKKHIGSESEKVGKKYF